MQTKTRRILLYLAIAIIVGIISSVFIIIFRSDCDKMVLKKGSIRIGYSIEPPYSYVNEDGTVNGLCPVIASEICESMGIQKIEWKLMEFGSLIESLNEGEIDVIAAGMFINENRNSLANFSEIIFKVQPGVLVLVDDSLNVDNLKIAVLKGSVEKQLLESTRNKDIKIMEFPDALTAKLAVKNGVADGLLLSSPSLRWMIAEDSIFKVLSPFFLNDIELINYGKGGFVFRKNDIEFLQEWNRAQTKVMKNLTYRKSMGIFKFSNLEIPEL